MTQSADLLRLLEPAVRPVAPASAVRPAATPPGQTPFEAQDFDTLLAQARTSVDPAETDPAYPNPAAAPAPGPLDALAHVGRIENPGLRALLALHQPAPGIDSEPAPGID
ncbi:MAG: hypothetical protein AAGG38_15355, partial [Planctomycetota bacterium]